MSDLILDGNARIGGTLRATAIETASIAGLSRQSLDQENLAKYWLDPLGWRVHDALGTPLSNAGSDDLGLVPGTFGTNFPTIQSGDVKALGPTTRYARRLLWLPHHYVAGQTVTLRFHAGMVTNGADNTATLDVEAYAGNGEAGVGSDLCETSAQDINSLTLADFDFQITPTLLAAGSVLDVRIAIATNDAATGTAVIALVGDTYLLLDVKG